LILELLAASALAAPSELSKTTLKLPDGAKLAVELALTPKEQEHGLMDRTELAEGTGMLFVFPDEQPLVFWMKNTWIDLDMVYIGADRRITKVFERVPRSYPDTPEDRLATTKAVGKYVLEIPSGYSKKHALAPGQKLEFKLPKLPPAPPSLRRAGEESLKTLLTLVRFDTRNPPGKERPAAAYLARLLQAEGVRAELLAAKPGRANLVARLRGTGEKQPLLLLSHLDTVGFERDRWSVDPLKGVIKEGYVYGRGVVDNKGLTAAELTALLWVKRNKLKLKRDIILAAVADEESGGHAGTRWLLEKHPDRIRAEYAVNEGGALTIQDGRIRIVGVQTAEKRYFDVRLGSRGTGGHSSAPAADNAIFTLASALTAVRESKHPFRLNDVTRAFFAGVRPAESSPTSTAIDDLLSSDASRQEKGAAVLSENPLYNSMLRDTAAPTVLKSGFRSNVVPSSAEALLNCRLLPDTDSDKFIETLRVVVGPRVSVDVTDRPMEPPPPLMPFDNDMARAFKEVSEEMASGAAVVPYMATGSTDSEYLRRAGILAYGFDLPLEAADHTRIHGDDERVAVGALGWSAVFLYRLIEELGR
jgi:acetylornithine deacetylase/succinyl-diaminopimelate desuccinylase-like protein/uncharacterized membrane protein (UPF0127 family)